MASDIDAQVTFSIYVPRSVCGLPCEMAAVWLDLGNKSTWSGLGNQILATGNDVHMVGFLVNLTIVMFDLTI